MSEYKRIKAELDKWDGLAEHVKNQITKLYDKEQKEHEKFINDQLKFYEQREELVKQREQILAGIEQEYAQNGVDILDNMGKAGKFMTHTAQASVSQERYAPITKKLDNMQKQLDHLSKIDSKMSKLNQNIGLL
jgi:DNA repair exonuclease SbcCD ATPase subunit